MLESGHILEVRAHAISPTLQYCYVMANCIPEQKVSQAPYDVWVLLEKGSGKIYSADCNCPAGVSGCCKHIGALLWHIESEVKLGKNVTCTGKAQEWHKPSKKLAKVYGPAFLIDINATKPQIKDSLLPIKKEISNRATFDPRPENHRAVALTKGDIDELAMITNFNCGIVNILMEKNVVSSPNIDDVALFVEVGTSDQPGLPKSLKKIVSELDTELSFNEFLILAKITMDDRRILEIETRGQSHNNTWFEHRELRMTASRMHAIIQKVSDNYEIKNPQNCKTVMDAIIRPSLINKRPPVY